MAEKITAVINNDLDKEEKTVDRLEPGDVAACDVFNQYGIKLISANTIMNEYIKEHLKLNQIEKIWVHDQKNLERRYRGQHQNIVKGYADTMACVRNILIDLSAGRQPDYSKVIEISKSFLQYNHIHHIIDFAKYTAQLRSADMYTYAHSVNVAFYSMFMAKWLRLPNKLVELAFQSGLLHDIGKIKIPGEILNKPGRLTKAEFDIMKKHPVYGYKLLLNVPEIHLKVKEAVLLHHERFDGSGYPLGIVTENVLAKIVSAADVYDAMTSNRVYKKNETPFKVFHYFVNDGITQFDNQILKVFITNMTAILTGSMVVLSSGETARVVYIPPDNPSKLVLQTGTDFIGLSADDPRLISISV